MNANVFEDDSILFLVLVNDENQHSLWPVHIDIPSGWTAVTRAQSRVDALAYIESNWTDMRPASLVATLQD